MDKPDPRRDDNGVPWCENNEKCPRAHPNKVSTCTWLSNGICFPQVQLDEAELVSVKGTNGSQLAEIRELMHTIHTMEDDQQQEQHHDQL